MPPPPAHNPAPAPVAVVDLLNSLLEAEMNNIIRFMGEGSPYLGRASGEVRRPLQEMVATNHRHTAELYRLIEHLGGEPKVRGIEREEQYLAYLSLKFLLPKLVATKELTTRRYENALKSLGPRPQGVRETLEAHLADLRGELKALEHAASRVAAGK